jgi:hypothetical protein
VLAGTFFLNKHPVIVHFDSRASHDFMSSTCAKKAKLSLVASGAPYVTSTRRGRVDADQIVQKVPLELSGRIFSTNLMKLNGQGIDVILGMMMRTSLLWIQPRLFIGAGVRLVFGLQESTYLRQLSRLHMDSNFGVLLLHGKITKSTLRRIHPHVDTLSESVTITDFIQRYILSTVSLFLYAFIDDSENRLVPNNVMMIRNYGEEKEGLKERCGGAKE